MNFLKKNHRFNTSKTYSKNFRKLAQNSAQRYYQNVRHISHEEQNYGRNRSNAGRCKECRHHVTETREKLQNVIELKNSRQ